MSDRMQVTLRCATMVILAVVLPVWLVAIPVAVLSVATGAAIVRRPELARDGLQALRSLLKPP